MQNYFNYFTEIEVRFQQRRGSLLMLSTLDWALIEAWRDAGVPLEAVLRGIDSAFDKHDAQKLRGRGRTRKVNGLAWAAQAVLEASEAAVDAATGVRVARESEPRESGFEAESVAKYLEHNAECLRKLPITLAVAERLEELAASVRQGGVADLEDLDRTLTVLEEKLYTALMSAAPEAELVALKEQAARELAPYRGRMQAVQIRQVEQQFVQKRMFEARGIPRLSLFYMQHG
jgi:hypothetical protein